MRKKGLILAAVLVVLLAAGFWFYSKLKIDPPDVVTFGESYFSKLQERRGNDAFAMYSEDFRRKDGGRWREIIDQLDARNGAIERFKVLDAPMGTVKLPGLGLAHCMIVPFKVRRRNLGSEETLTIVCDDSGACTIVGHEIKRLDNGEHLTAGWIGVEDANALKDR